MGRHAYRFVQLTDDTDIARIGRPPKLNNKDRNILCEIVEQHPQQPAVMLEQLRERTNKLISRPTLRRVLRDLGYCWKRLRRSLSKQRNPEAFALAAEELKEFSSMPHV